MTWAEERTWWTEWCWRSGPAAWMGHNDLPLSFFFTLPQNKLSLDHFHIVPRLSYSLGLKRKGGWQIFTACASLAQRIKLEAFFKFWWCFPRPSSSLVCPFPPPALPTPSTFLHPSFHGCCFHCFFYPWQSSPA